MILKWLQKCLKSVLDLDNAMHEIRNYKNPILMSGDELHIKSIRNTTNTIRSNRSKLISFYCPMCDIFHNDYQKDKIVVINENIYCDKYNKYGNEFESYIHEVGTFVWNLENKNAVTKEELIEVLPLVAKYLTHTRSVTNLKKCLFKDWYMEYRYACSPINPNFDHVC